MINDHVWMNEKGEILIIEDWGHSTRVYHDHDYSEDYDFCGYQYFCCQLPEGYEYLGELKMKQVYVEEWLE